ncbi:MAG: cupin domain-containing protein [Oscillospiraceae bacterium]|nr:cupin domain-containing protein [Oscillospiraceae bacterium]
MEQNEELVRRIVEEVLRRAQQTPCREQAPFQKTADPSGILLVKTDTVRCQPFEQDGVSLQDIVTLEEAPRMGAGVMELDHTSFEWTLSYDEYDMVISGVLEIEIDGRRLTGGPGDILYIPKGSHIHFCTPDKARYAYFVYPADWQSKGE